MSEKKDNDLIKARKQELLELYESNKISLEKDHKIKNIPARNINKNGEQKILTLNSIKWTKKDVIYKLFGILITVIIVAILILLAYYIGESVK